MQDSRGGIAFACNTPSGSRPAVNSPEKPFLLPPFLFEHFQILARGVQLKPEIRR